MPSRSYATLLGDIDLSYGETLGERTLREIRHVLNEALGKDGQQRRRCQSASAVEHQL